MNFVVFFSLCLYYQSQVFEQRNATQNILGSQVKHYRKCKGYRKRYFIHLRTFIPMPSMYTLKSSPGPTPQISISEQLPFKGPGPPNNVSFLRGVGLGSSARVGGRGGGVGVEGGVGGTCSSSPAAHTLREL